MIEDENYPGEWALESLSRGRFRKFMISSMNPTIGDIEKSFQQKVERILSETEVSSIWEIHKAINSKKPS